MRFPPQWWRDARYLFAEIDRLRAEPATWQPTGPVIHVHADLAGRLGEMGHTGDRADDWPAGGIGT